MPIAAFTAATIIVAATVAPDPCALFSKADLVKITHWTITSVERKSFALPMGSGTMCAYDAKEGDAVVTVPDGSSAFLGTNPVTDPNDNGIANEIKGFRAYVYVANGTVYMEALHSGRAASVRLTPNDAPPSTDELTAIARVVVPRLTGKR